MLQGSSHQAAVPVARLQAPFTGMQGSEQVRLTQPCQRSISVTLLFIAALATPPPSLPLQAFKEVKRLLAKSSGKK